jgi:hypothetical protein
MGTPAGRDRVEAAREAVRRYGGRAIDALRPLTVRVRSLAERLGARALALARDLWRDRGRLLGQGGGWLRRHRLAVWVVLTVLFIVSLIGLVVLYLPDRVLTWRFWTRRPEDVRNLSLVALGCLGVLAGAIGVVFSYFRTGAANLQAEVAEQGHITDRFTKAVEQLGNDKLEVRLVDRA